MDEDNKYGLMASDVFAELKSQLRFMKILVALLIFLLAATNIYHIHQWSLFDTVTVDSGSGYANYVAGDNTGGVYNGADSGSQEEGREVEGDTDQSGS